MGKGHGADIVHEPQEALCTQVWVPGHAISIVLKCLVYLYKCAEPMAKYVTEAQKQHGMHQG